MEKSKSPIELLARFLLKLDTIDVDDILRGYRFVEAFKSIEGGKDFSTLPTRHLRVLYSEIIKPLVLRLPTQQNFTVWETIGNR